MYVLHLFMPMARTVRGHVTAGKDSDEFLSTTPVQVGCRRVNTQTRHVTARPGTVPSLWNGSTLTTHKRSANQDAQLRKAKLKDIAYGLSRGPLEVVLYCCGPEGERSRECWIRRVAVAWNSTSGVC